MKRYILLGALASLPSLSHGAITTGLVAYFDFESAGTTQTNRAQAVGSDVTGTLVNGTLLNADSAVGATAVATAGAAGGKFGNGLSVTPTTAQSSGMNVAIGTGGVAGNGNLGTSFTISTWFKLDAGPLVTNANRYFVWEDSQANSIDSTPEVSLEMRGGTAATGAGYTPQFYVGGSGTRTAGAADVNTWVFGLQTFAFDGSNYIVTSYINGAAVGTPVSTATVLSPGLNFGRARDETNNRGFDGTLDDIALWNRVLTGEEISYLAAGGVIPEPATALLGGAGALLLLRRRRVG